MDRVLCVIFCIVVMVVAICVLANCGKPTIEITVEPTTMPTVAESTQESAEVVTEPTETEPTETEPPVVLYDVPLDAELQLHIIEEADENGIDPAIVMAMAYKESSYRPNAVGDGGKSIGLLQIQPRWHRARMDKLGCTDLLDPYQNVVVGIDYLCDLLSKYGDMGKALTAYNKGHYNGTVTQYAKTILAKAEKLNNERSQ
jgi:soluble lytic murein transglycosylase-like protein